MTPDRAPGLDPGARSLFSRYRRGRSGHARSGQTARRPATPPALRSGRRGAAGPSWVPKSREPRRRPRSPRYRGPPLARRCARVRSPDPCAAADSDAPANPAIRPPASNPSRCFPTRTFRLRAGLRARWFSGLLASRACRAFRARWFSGLLASRACRAFRARWFSGLLASRACRAFRARWFSGLLASRACRALCARRFPVPRRFPCLPGCICRLSQRALADEVMAGRAAPGIPRYGCP
ncbi:hypothetical protein J2S43_007753 [Catenuloplanes nepalensis]|uniref:Uncharacterized protein n=1 Tax=Catenuloplanes nepalensis TaxID=587533 RepID=A0ABT9N6C5_9ACTN|nr:hypothetical protein [Catenuloplanes nepalensis]